MPVPKSSQSDGEIDVDEVTREAKGLIDKVIKDVGKTSATKQVVIGVASGWCTGYLGMKVGKAAAIAAGGGILLLQFAAHKGYINVNWERVCRQVDKATDKIEKEATGKGPGLAEKMEKFVDRKLNKAEDILKNNKRKVRHWYNSKVKEDGSFLVTETHVFCTAYVLGLALGMMIHRFPSP